MSKTIVITGGTGGIGYQEALLLATAGHTVIITGRSQMSGDAAVEYFLHFDGGLFTSVLKVFNSDKERLWSVTGRCSHLVGLFVFNVDKHLPSQMFL